MTTFQVGNVTLNGYEALPSGGSGPGIIALHAWWGQNAFFKEFCNRLAREGFVVFAPDLYHGAVAATIEEAEKLSSSLEDQVLSQEIPAAVEYLRKHPAVKSPSLGAVGFSLGAFVALRMAQKHPDAISTVVLFYGTGDGQYDQSRASFLGHFAETDPFESADSVQGLEKALRDAGRDVEFHTYPGTGHWFFEQDRPDAYKGAAARLAWDRTLAFLKQHVK